MSHLPKVLPLPPYCAPIEASANGWVCDANILKIGASHPPFPLAFAPTSFQFELIYFEPLFSCKNITATRAPVRMRGKSHSSQNGTAQLKKKCSTDIGLAQATKAIFAKRDNTVVAFDDGSFCCHRLACNRLQAQSSCRSIY